MYCGFTMKVNAVKFSLTVDNKKCNVSTLVETGNAFDMHPLILVPALET